MQHTESNKKSGKVQFLISIGVMSLLTMLSRILGLVREMVRAWLLGTSFYSDAFIMGFSLPNLFRRLTAEGAMVNAFIPTFTTIRHQEGDEAAMQFAGEFFSLFSLLLSLFCAGFIFLAPWLVKYLFAIGFEGETLRLTILLTRIMFVYIVFISLAALCQGVLNSFSVFWVSSFTPILLNLSIVVCALFFFSRLSNPTYGFAIGVIVGGFMQFYFQVLFLKGKIRFFQRFSLGNVHIREVGKLMLPGIFGVGIYQINIVVSNLIASTLGEGAVSSLSFSNRILELILGVFVVSLTTALFPRLSRLFVQNNSSAMEKNLKDGLRLIAFVVIPVLGGIYITSDELIRLLFMRGKFDQTSLVMTVQALKFHILGLLFIGWNRILIIGFHARKDFKTPVKIAAIVLIVNIVGCLIFPYWHGHAGIALAGTASQIVQTIFLFLVLQMATTWNLFSKQLLKSLSMNLLCAFIMIVSIFYAKEWLAPLQFQILPNYLLLMVVGAGSYYTSCLVMKNEELTQILALIKTRKNRK